MHLSEPLPDLADVIYRPRRRAGQVIAYSVMTTGGFVGAAMACQFFIWPDFVRVAAWVGDRIVLSVSPVLLWPDFYISKNWLFIDQRLWLVVQSAIVFGALVGVAQWIVIRRWMRELIAGAGDQLPDHGRRVIRASTWWIVATTGGCLVGSVLACLLVWALDIQRPLLLNEMMLNAVGGAILGTAQWFYLNRYVCCSGRWIWYSIIGYLVALLPNRALIVIAGLPFFLVNKIFFTYVTAVVFGVTYGAVQGLCMVPFKLLPNYGGAPAGGFDVRAQGWATCHVVRLCVVAGLYLFTCGLIEYGASLESTNELFMIVFMKYPISFLYIGLLCLVPLSAFIARRSRICAFAATVIGGLASTHLLLSTGRHVKATDPFYTGFSAVS